MSRDLAEFIDGSNLYTYALNRPTLFRDPLGLTVYLQTHEVGGGYDHLSLLIVPDDQTQKRNRRKEDRPCLPYSYYVKASIEGERKHRWLLTIGAGPESGLWDLDKLHAAFNRPTDFTYHKEKVALQRPSRYKTEDEWICCLVTKTQYFRDNWNGKLDYDLFSKRERKWFVADDGYNSKSFIVGLLYACAYSLWSNHPRLPFYGKKYLNWYWWPGVDNMVHPKKFGKEKECCPDGEEVEYQGPRVILTQHNLDESRCLA